MPTATPDATWVSAAGRSPDGGQAERGRLHPHPQLPVARGRRLGLDQSEHLGGLPHDFDALAWLSDDRPVEVFARGSVLVDEMFARHGDVDTSVAVVTLAGGAMAVLTGTRQTGVGYDHRTEAIGSLDSVSAGLGEHMPLRSADPGGPQPVDPYPSFPVRFHDAYLAEVEAFAALVAGTGPNRCPGRAAVDALRLALAADRSLATGRPVTVADITA